MRPLKEVVVALRRELEEALRASRKPDDRGGLEAERITVTLELAVTEAPGASGEQELSFGVLFADVKTADAAERPVERPKTTTVTIEFKPRAGRAGDPALEGALTATVAEARATQPADLKVDWHRKVETLVQVFGAPGGFYSQNRSEVFRSALEGLSDDGYAVLVSALKGQPVPKEEPEIAQAYGQICNILRSGPAGSVEKGTGLLREALNGISRSEACGLVAGHWRKE